MSDRIRTLTVVLDKDYRDDDCEHIINAILMVKGVISVDPHINNLQDYVARSTSTHDLGMKIIDVINEHRRASNG